MQKIGSLGENLVGRWLQLQNYHLLQQNWRCRWGEIDIVAQDKINKTIAFVEVKTRSQNSWDENGLLAVNATKQQKILTTASVFLGKYPHLAELPCRFDVALVSYKNISNSHSSPADKLANVSSIEMGQAITINQHQLILENYLQSAFE